MLKIFKQYYPIRNIFFVLGESLVIFFSVLLSCIILMDNEAYLSDIFVREKIVLTTIVFITCLYYNDLYNFKIVNSFVELGIRMAQSIGTSAVFLSIVYFIFPSTVIYKGVFFTSVFFMVLFIVSWRMGYNFILKKGYMNQRIILIGSGHIADNISKEISANIDCGYTIAARHSPDTVNNAELPSGTEKTNLSKYALQMNIEKIVVAIYERRGIFPSQELLKCRVAGIDIIEGDSFYESLTGKLIVKHNKPAWLIFSQGFSQSFLKRLLKRASDLLISLIFLICCFPILICVAVLIKLDSKGPVFFTQVRLGKNKKPYSMYKFRSMVQNAEKESGPIWAKQEDSRVTAVGIFIRKWRLDELPQLINIVKGEMSFVGPRPEREYFVNQLIKEIPYYSERFSIKPGLTGWAQVNYRYGDSVEDAVEKLNYDLFYIKNLSFFMDIVIIFRTVRTVLFGVGAR